MAPTSEDSKDLSTETNPFVLFRRFADDSISAAFNAVRSPLHAIQAGNKDFDEAFDKLEKDVELRNKGFWMHLERSFERTMNPERKQIESTDADDALPSSHTLASHMTEAGCPAADGMQEREDVATRMLEAGCPAAGSVLQPQNVARRMAEAGCPAAGAVQGDSQGPPLGSSDPMDSRAVWPAPTFTEPFFDRSPYSPLQLEAEADLQGVKWRHAFEDLLLAEEDTAFHGYRDPEIDRIPGSEWKRLIFSSGLLHPRFHAPSAASSAMTAVQDMAYGRDREVAELAAYSEKWHKEVERMMAHHDHNASGAEPRAARIAAATAEGDCEDEKLLANTAAVEPRSRGFESGKPSVLSMLTTTERTFNPDGSSTEKRILRRRFADGREETEETWKSIAEPEASRTTRRDADHTTPSVTDKVNEGKKSSWFWSA